MIWIVSQHLLKKGRNSSPRTLSLTTLRLMAQQYIARAESEFDGMDAGILTRHGPFNFLQNSLRLHVNEREGN